MQTKSIALRIDTKLLECLETRAAREHRTLSNMIVSILLDEMERTEYPVSMKSTESEKQCPNYADSHSCYWCVFKNTENCPKQKQSEVTKSDL